MLSRTRIAPSRSAASAKPRAKVVRPIAASVRRAYTAQANLSDEKAKLWQQQADVIHAPFLNHLGIKFLSLSKGHATSYTVLKTHHQQQHGLVHAGVSATIADHTAGTAASTLLKNPSEHAVVTLEFKINLLRAGKFNLNPSKQNILACRGSVLKPGSIFVSQADVFMCEAPVEANEADISKLIAQPLPGKHIARATVSLMMVGKAGAAVNEEAKK